MRPLDALRQHFGFPAFRPGQAEVVDAALAGRDVLVVMPTGSGKSLCYQLPALMRDDLTIVVSPLVALMQDQVEAMDAVAPGRVAVINAQQAAAANASALARAAAGELRLLYVAPERFAARGFFQAVREARIGLFVVDEAHCVSEWGHDFRPDYFRLGDAARALGAQAIIASTATATPRVAHDVARRLGLDDPLFVRTGFDRPNLSFAVARCGSARDRDQRLVAALRAGDALPAIVYAGTRDACERLASTLAQALRRPALAYHAGLERGRRSEVQRRFMSGEVDLVVATNAFGMGVDKADVRTVCHVAVPGSLEAYYQEAGRAGRDGEPARCLLLAERRDKGLHTWFIRRASADEQTIARVGAALERAADGDRYDVGAGELAAQTGAEPEALRAILGHLARAGVIRPAPAAVDRVRGQLVAPCDGRALARCRAFLREAERARWAQFRSVWAFVEDERCRRTAILRHFGDPGPGDPAGPCCDVCDPELRPPVPHQAVAAGSGATRNGDGLAGAGSDGGAGDLDRAIVAVVRAAQPPVGRTRAVEILRGGRSKSIRRHAYDGLPGYGTFAHLSRDDVLGRVDELLEGGEIRSSGGRYPTLVAA